MATIPKGVRKTLIPVWIEKGRSMKKVIILSNMFPDANFVRAEVSYLDHRNEVFYFPKALGIYDKIPDLDFPSKVKVFPIKDYWPTFKSKAKVEKVIRLLPLFLSCFFWRGVVDVLLHKNNSGDRIIPAKYEMFKQMLSFLLQADEYVKDIRCAINAEHQVGGSFIQSEDELVIYAYRFHYHSLAAVFLKKRFPGARIIVRAHGYDLYEERHSSGYLPFRKFLLSSVDYVGVISKDGYNYLNSHYSCSNKIELDYLGVEDHGVEEWRESNVLRIVSCSRIAREKRIEKMFDIFAAYPGNLEWIHIGPGDKIEEFRAKADALSTENKKFEFIGFLTQTEIVEFYREHPFDLFVNTSKFEGIPVTMMEAISFGIPLLAFDVGGISEMITDQKSGFLFAEGTKTDQIVEVMLRFHNLSEEEKIAFRREARERYEKLFSAKRNFIKFFERNGI